MYEARKRLVVDSTTHNHKYGLGSEHLYKRNESIVCQIKISN